MNLIIRDIDEIISNLKDKGFHLDYAKVGDGSFILLGINYYAELNSLQDLLNHLNDLVEDFWRINVEVLRKEENPITFIRRLSNVYQSNKDTKLQHDLLCLKERYLLTKKYLEQGIISEELYNEKVLGMYLKLRNLETLVYKKTLKSKL